MMSSTPQPQDDLNKTQEPLQISQISSPADQWLPTTVAAPSLPEPPKRQRGRPRAEITEEQREEVHRLKDFYGQRKIAGRVGISRHRVSQILEEGGSSQASDPPAPSSSKLDPFRDAIESRVNKHLTISRIQREIEALGYNGGRTILAEQVRELRTSLTGEPAKTPKRRFETAPGEEMQIDWSPFRVLIGTAVVCIRALCCLLCFSRKLYLRFFRDERQSTLLEGLADAFAYFRGVTQRVVLDNMSTAVLGRIGSDRKPLWHPRFLDFARHYGFEPFACRVRDPDRKGKDEKAFRLVWDDFLKSSEFSSWEDLDRRRAVWLDQTPKVGNLRLHGTTRRVPNEAWLDEQPLLIQLPETRFAVHEESARIVDHDGTLSIGGTRYSVPATLADRSVAVRLYADYFEVLAPSGKVAFSRAYVSDEDKGKLILDRTHYANLPRRPAGGVPSAERLDEAFVQRFPELTPFIDGLKLRMKALAPVHIRSLLRLCDHYGQEAFVAAVRRAQLYRRFDANAVGRILERAHPLPDGDHIAPLRGIGPVVIGEVDPPSFDGFSDFDQAALGGTPANAQPEDPRHGS
jgi:transposase